MNSIEQTRIVSKVLIPFKRLFNIFLWLIALMEGILNDFKEARAQCKLETLLYTVLQNDQCYFLIHICVCMYIYITIIIVGRITQMSQVQKIYCFLTCRDAFPAKKISFKDDLHLARRFTSVICHLGKYVESKKRFILFLSTTIRKR